MSAYDKVSDPFADVMTEINKKLAKARVEFNDKSTLPERKK